MRTITSIVLGSRVVCSRSGSEIFSPTDIEPISAPPWKAKPMRLRISSISRAPALVISTPLMWTSPEDGLSSPTRVLSIVLFPEPDPPITTSVSPRRTSNVSPCRTSRLPYCTRRLDAEMIASGEAIRSGASPGQIEQGGEDQIDQDHQQN